MHTQDDACEYAVCEKGHLIVLDRVSKNCTTCNRQIVHHKCVVFGRKSTTSQLNQLYTMLRRVRELWIKNHGDDGEILDWCEGMIIAHAECGGLGVICTFRSEDSEPDEYYVRWVVLPDWSRKTVDSCPKSVWVSGRKSHFKKANAIQCCDVVS